MKIFIHYIYEREEKEMEQAVELLVDNGFDNVYAVPVESHED